MTAPGLVCGSEGFIIRWGLTAVLSVVQATPQSNEDRECFLYSVATHTEGESGLRLRLSLADYIRDISWLSFVTSNLER